MNPDRLTWWRYWQGAYIFNRRTWPMTRRAAAWDATKLVARYRVRPMWR